jgi:hypothetical protein
MRWQWWQSRRWLVVMLATLMMSACGDSTPRTTPTSPTPPTTPTPPEEGQAPDIVIATVSPDVCVPGLTTLQAHVVARASGLLTYSWAFGPAGKALATTADATFSCEGQSNANGLYYPVYVTVTDSKGRSSKQSVGYAAGDLSGSYYGRIGDKPEEGRGEFYSVFLRRNGNAITGTISSRDHYGTVDPAEPGYLGADGSFRVRFKLQSDFTFIGKLVFDPSFKYEAAYYGIGRVEGGEFDGQRFLMRLSVD